MNKIIKIKSKLIKSFLVYSQNYQFEPIFICGVSGSGTTLISSLLDQNYDNVCCLHESALQIQNNSPLKMKNVGYYHTLENYYNNMFLKSQTTIKAVYESTYKLYYSHFNKMSQSNIVFDKAPNVHCVRTKYLKSAFPQSKFILVFRNPVDSIEGLRRKWSVFRCAKLEELCDFWESLHKIFLEETQDFQSEVTILCYQDIINNTDKVMNSIAKIYDLTKRNILKSYPEQNNIPKKGLRNVIDGKIVIDKSSISKLDFALTQEECDFIYQRLFPMYKELKKISLAS